MTEKSRSATPRTHLSADGSLEPDADGWYHACCACGFTFGPLPDLTEVVDVLMEHVLEMGEVPRFIDSILEDTQ